MIDREIKNLKIHLCEYIKCKLKKEFGERAYIKCTIKKALENGYSKKYYNADYLENQLSTEESPNDFYKNHKFKVDTHLVV